MRPAVWCSTSAMPRRRRSDGSGRGSRQRGRAALDALGNGSLMRIVPLALVMRASEDEELVDLAARASRVTHASAEAQIACALYSLIVRRLLAGETDRDAVLAGARAGLRAVLSSHGLSGSPIASEPAAALAALDAFESWPGRAGRGHVVDSFWSAWDAFAKSSDYRETVISAVRYGNDTDTTAAIAGGLAGAYWGIAGIPSAWQDGLRDRHIPQDLVDRLIETDHSVWGGEPKPWRTSRMSPLRVDALDLSGTGLAERGGRVGITFLPGKRYLGIYTGPHWRDLRTDAARLHDLGVDTLLLLVEDSELEECRVTDIAEVLPAFGVELLRFPVEDPLTPTDGVAFRETIVAALERVRTGSFLAIACRGGLDRSGLAAACLLREAGLGADDAIDRVHAARRRSLTIHEQQAFVRAWPPPPPPTSSLSPHNLTSQSCRRMSTLPVCQTSMSCWPVDVAPPRSRELADGLPVRGGLSSLGPGPSTYAVLPQSRDRARQRTDPVHLPRVPPGRPLLARPTVGERWTSSKHPGG